MTYPAPPSPHRLGLVAGALCLAATVATLLGAFLDLLSADVTDGEHHATLTVDAWGFATTTGGEGAPFGEVPTSAPPIVVAAILLLVATAVGGYSALPGAAPMSRRAAGTATVAATAFLAGVVWTVVLQVSSQLDSIQSTARDAGLDVDAGAGAGYWLLLAAVVLSIAAVVCALLPPRRRQPPDGWQPAGEGWMRPVPYRDYLGAPRPDAGAVQEIGRPADQDVTLPVDRPGTERDRPE